MRLSAHILVVVTLALVGVSNGDLVESSGSDRLDDFGDLSSDDNESEPHSDLSHLSDDEFLAGDAEGGAAAGPGRPGELQAEKSAMMLRVMGATLKRPGMTQRFGQILPIIRVMSPPQRLALVALVMQQAMVPEHVNDPPLQMAMQLGATPDGKSNLTSQLLLPLSADIAHIFRGAGLPKAGPNAAVHQDQDQGQVGQGRSVGGQGAPYRPLHQVPPPRWQKPHVGVVSAAMPPSLAGPRAPPHLEVAQQRPQQRPQRFYGDLDLPPPGANRRSGHVGLGMRPPPPPGRTSTTLRPFTTLPPHHHGCSLFSDTVCATVDHYPEEAILASMDADKHTVDALLTDKLPPGARSVALPEMQRRQDDDYPPGSPQDLDGQDGQDGVDDTHLCASVIKYARPQRARATSGQWKFIVNTAEHTQTLRLEKCTRLDEPCNYMPDKVRSHCTQVYNYHRLLTWDKEKGLHIDIFKVPTCCSCEVLKSPFLTSNVPPRRPGGYVPQHLQQQQPIADFSQQHETVAVSESGRPVPPQYALKPFNQQVDESRREPLPTNKPAGSSKPTWPFRRAATRRPPVQGQGLHGQYGLQTLEDSAGPGDLLPQYPPLQDQYPPLAGRRTGSTRNRTRLSDPDDLTAEGTVRRAAPAILHPDGSAVPNAVRVPAAATATSKRPLPPVLPPRLETYRPRATTAAATASTTPAPIIIPTSTAAPGAPSTPAPKRINYSYHPIIDFFRPLEKQMSAQEPRHAPPSAPAAPQLQEVAEQRTAPDDAPPPGPSWSAQQSDWNPITKTPSRR